jgi:hypothetical protein
MSGAYSLFHVFNELLDEKANKNTTARGKTMGAKSEIYQGSWSALNAWIETKLAKQKVCLRFTLFSNYISTHLCHFALGRGYFWVRMLLLGAKAERRNNTLPANIYHI